jgi:hypothetical protein
MATGRIGTTPVLTTRWSKQPAAGTTSLSGLDDNSVSLVYSVGYEAVYRNGTLLSRGNDYTATDGTTITLVDATLTGDIIEVFANQTVPLTDTYSQTVANSLFVNQATFDAKGDLIAGTADNAYTKLSVGSNGDTLVADSSTSTGLRWQGSTAAGRNFAINGGFDIWQRGTSSTSSGVYLADRWIHGRAGGATGGTYTRQTATDSSTLPFLQYSFRLQRDSGNTGTAQLNLNQVIETANSLPLAGRTVTLSFYARVGANFSATNGAVVCYLFTGTGTDQNGVLGAWTGSANPLSTSFTGATTTWQRFQATATLSNTTNEIYFGIGFNPTGTAGAADWLEIAGVQLELGSIATTFTRAGGTLAGELAACQRYYYRATATSSTKFITWCMGMNTSSTVFRGLMPLPLQMRTAPTAVEWSGSGTIRVTDQSSYNASVTALSVNAGESSQYGMRIDATTTGLTTNQPAFLSAYDNATAYIGFSAEL